MFFWLEPNLTKWFGVAKRTKKDHFVLCFSLMKSTKNQGLESPAKILFKSLKFL